MRHFMKLKPKPFEAILNGSKTIEMRLFDEKRRKVRVADEIEFTEDPGGRRILTKVTALHRFDSFEELYRSLPHDKLGYGAHETESASPKDMEAYYTPEQQEKYGALGIELKLI